MFTFDHSPDRMTNGDGVLTELLSIRYALTEHELREAALARLPQAPSDQDVARIFSESSEEQAAALETCEVHVIASSLRPLIFPSSDETLTPDADARWTFEAPSCHYLTHENMIVATGTGTRLLGTLIENVNASAFRTDFLIIDDTLIPSLRLIAHLGESVSATAWPEYRYLRALYDGALQRTKVQPPPDEAAMLIAAGWTRLPSIHLVMERLNDA